MIIHTAIRNAVLTALRENVSKVMIFDGRPGFLDAQDLPAIAVYLSDAESTGNYLDGDMWQATLHIEVFLKASSPDAELDLWVEEKIYPTMARVPALDSLVESVSAQGYDYQRDDEAMTWGSADLKYSLTYYL